MRPFSTIKIVAEDVTGLKNPRIDVVIHHGCLLNGSVGSSVNICDFVNTDGFEHTAHKVEVIPFSDAKTRLPVDGRIRVHIYPNDDFYHRNRGWAFRRISRTLDIKGGQVSAVNGREWIATREIESSAIIHDTVKRLLMVLRRSKAYTWNGRNQPKVKISFHPRRVKSLGGVNGLSFALHPFIRDELSLLQEKATLHEYASFADDPDIGTISGNWRIVIKALVAHEMAHWAQYSRDVTKKGWAIDYRKPHGVGFQEIYRFLRLKAVDKNNQRYTPVQTESNHE